MKKIFLSYSLKGNDLSISNLKKFKKNLSENTPFNLYVDILDNFSADISFLSKKIQITKKNIESPFQKKLKLNLSSSNLLCIINTPSIRYSKWVHHEIILAKKLNIPILIIPYLDFINFISLNSQSDIIHSSVISQIFSKLSYKN